MNKRKRIPWTDAQIKLLGTMTDADVSYKIKRPPQSIYLKRVELGIPAFFVAAPKIDWPQIVLLLGTTSDVDLARKFSISIGSVRRRRLALGIPRYSPPVKALADELMAMLGRFPDNLIAIQAKLSCERIRQIRDAYGIPAPPRATEIVNEYFLKELDKR